MTKNIKQHENNYWHIPKFAILPIIATIFFSWLSYLNLKLIDWDIVKIAFHCKVDDCNLQSNTLINIYPIIGEYILIALSIISLVAIIKNGFSNLKSYDGGGLIGGLIYGLIMGLITGLIMGLIGGLIMGLIGGLIYGLIMGLIVGLIGGLIKGLIGGLIEEFEDD